MQSLFDYNHYTDFLKDWIKNQPKNGRGIMKTWSELLRVEPSVLSQIISKKRKMNLDQAYELSTFLNLSEIESEYFFTLIDLENANTYKLRNHLHRKLSKIKKDSLNLSNRVKHNKKLSTEQQAQFYSSWIYSAVNLATSIGEKETPETIADRLNLSREKIIEVLNFLLECGLVKQELGVYKMGNENTFLDKSSPFLVKHHANWRMKAIQRSDLLTDEELMFTAPLSISKKDFSLVREEIVKLIARIGEVVQESESDQLAVFQTDFFLIK